MKKTAIIIAAIAFVLSGAVCGAKSKTLGSFIEKVSSSLVSFNYTFSMQPAIMPILSVPGYVSGSFVPHSSRLFPGIGKTCFRGNKAFCPNGRWALLVLYGV